MLTNISDKERDACFDFVDDETSIIDHTLFQYTTRLEHLHCPICQLPFYNPYTTSCGHTFCHPCLEESLKMAGMKCPLDRTPLNPTNINDIYPSPLIVKNLLDELPIKCMNEKRGCKWTGSRWRIQKHLLGDCDYTRFKCNVDKDCGKLTERRFLDSDDNCVHRQITCECGESMMAFEKLAHLEEDCNLKLVQCNGCNLQFTKKELDDHESCCEKLYMKCHGSKHGCDWKGTKLLFDTVHQRNCQFIKMGAYLNKQDEKINKLQETNLSLQSQISTILDSIVQGKVSNLGFGLNYDEVSSSSFISSRSPQQDEIENVQLFIELEKLKLDIAKLTSSSSPQEHVLSSLINENLRFKDELNFQKNSINSLRQQLHFLLLERRRSSSSMFYHGLSNYSSDEENNSSSSVNGIKL